LCSLEVSLHFSDKITQGRRPLRPVLAGFVPIVRPQGKKNANGNGDDLQEQAEK
jgi:hypothetical protein